MNSINEKHLREFLLLSETGDIHSAAQALQITPQGLHKSIRRMEEDLGTVLFVRTGKGLELTAEGAELKNRAPQLIEEFVSISGDGLALAAAEGITGKCTNVFLDITNGEIDWIRLSCIRDFMQKNPGILVSVNECSDRAVMNHVLNGRADIGICAGPINSSLFTGVYLHSNRHCIVVSRDHPLAGKESVRFADLKDQKLIFNSTDYATCNNNMNRCLKAGFTPEIVFHTQNLENAHLLAEKGEGVVISVEDVVEKQRARGVFPDVAVIPFASDEDCGIDLFLITRREGGVTAEAALLKQYIAEIAKSRFR